MLRVEEFLDMDALEKLRTACFGSGLDEWDNFSWHIALKDGERLCGAARLYRAEDKSLRLDRVAIADRQGPLAANFREMLFRTLMLKCTVSETEWVTAVPETEDAFYLKFGFVKGADGFFRARVNELRFPKLCKECGT